MPDFIGPLSHHIHTSTEIPYNRAVKWMSAYTSRSQQHPHMHPDSLLGRTLAFGTAGASGGVTLTQLRKVAQGLRGERLTPEPEEAPKEKKAFAGGAGKRKTFEDAPQEGEKVVDDGTKESEWVDADQWAEQRDGNEIGEIGERHNFVAEVEDGHAPEVEVVEDAEASSKSQVDKEKRKAEKKAKRKAERQESEANKRRKAAED